MPTSSFNRTKNYVKANFIATPTQVLVPVDNFAPTEKFVFSGEQIYDQAVYTGGSWINAKVNTNNFIVSLPDGATNAWFYLTTPIQTYTAGDPFYVDVYIGNDGPVNNTGRLTMNLNFNKNVLQFDSITVINDFSGTFDTNPANIYDNDEEVLITATSDLIQGGIVNERIVRVNFTVLSQTDKFPIFIRNCTISLYTAVPQGELSLFDQLSLIQPEVNSVKVAILQPEGIYTNLCRGIN